MTEKDDPRADETPNFEESFKRLVEIVQALEEGEGSLSEMTALFEEGVRLSRICSEQLDSVERKVEILLGEADDETLAPFNPETSDANA